jgi:hypothetical protein
MNPKCDGKEFKWGGTYGETIVCSAEVTYKHGKFYKRTTRGHGDSWDEEVFPIDLIDKNNVTS